MFPCADGDRHRSHSVSTAKLDATSATIKASGEFTDTGTLQLPIGNPRTITFKFARGNLVVLNATGPTSGPLHLNKATCAFSQSLAGTYRILSGPSTGSYAGATGHGWYAFDTERVASKTSDDGCNTGGHPLWPSRFSRSGSEGRWR